MWSWFFRLCSPLACSGTVTGGYAPPNVPDTGTPVDADGDGYVASEDCDDSNPDINPAEPERCDPDDVDEDCDGAADDLDTGDVWGARSSWVDDDGDGYGDPDREEVRCDKPAGNATRAGDCDDEDANVSPAATEVCDTEGRDDDCNGLADDDDPDLDTTTRHRWYPDSDADDFGDPGVMMQRCAKPAGHIDNPDDCDDTRHEVNPNATEICGDGLDDDCDGKAGECGLANTTVVSDSTSKLAKISGIGSGDLLAWDHGLAAGDLDDDGRSDVVVGAYMADGEETMSGAAYVFFGPVSNASAADAPVVAEGESWSDLTGGAILANADLDGVGPPDLVVGSRGWSGTADSAGLVTMFVSSAYTSSPLTRSEDAFAWWYGDARGDHLGDGLAAGDFDGHGASDLVIVATGADDAYVFDGSIGAGEHRLRDAAMTVHADVLDSVVTTGDLDADGLDEIVFGVEDEQWGAAYRSGAVYVVDGNLAGTVDLASSARFVASTGTYGDCVGSSVAVGDVTGDGYPDLVIGADHDDEGGTDAGAVYVLAGSLTTTAADLKVDYDLKLLGEQPDDHLGASVAIPGNVSGEGEDSDIVIGAPGSDHNGSDSGAVFVLFGPLRSGGTVTTADGMLYGEHAGDLFGSALAPAGDVDADGLSDFLVSAPYDSSVARYAGAAWVVAGGAF